MVSRTEHIFESSTIEHSSSKENCTNVIYNTIDPIWPSLGILKNLIIYFKAFVFNVELMSTSKSSSIADFYPESYSSSSSISSFDNHSRHINIPELKTFSSSSGYNSSLNSIPDQLFSSSSDCNLDEQFLNLHLDNQTFQEYVQLNSDTDDESQSTIVPSQSRPRSLPIAIQSSKYVSNDSHCTINRKNSLKHFIMSPTDKVKIQMKYQENNVNSFLDKEKVKF